MPHPRQAISLFDMFFLTNRGLYSPAPVFEPGFWAIPAAFGIAIVAVVLLVRWAGRRQDATGRSEEHTSELQSLMRISYAVFCLKKKTDQITRTQQIIIELHRDYHKNTTFRFISYNQNR